MKYKILFLATALNATLSTSAQELRSTYFMQTSDLRHEMNPALLDHSYVSMPLLGYMNIGTTGNVGAKKFIFDMQPSWEGYGVDGRTRTTFMHPDVDAKDFLDGLKNNNRLGANLKWQVIGLGFKGFGGINSIELNVRSCTNVSMPKSLFEFMKTAGGKSDYTIKNLGARSENFAELALGHSHKVNDKWRVGGKVKVLFGAAYADLNASRINLHLDDDYWRVSGNITAQAALLGAGVKESNKTDPNDPDRHRVKGIDDNLSGLGGMGAAIDLGVTWQPIEHLTVSASLTDLGGIGWKNTQCMSSAGDWTFDGFDQDIYAGGSKENGSQLDDQFSDLGDDLGDMFALYSDGSKRKGHALSPTLHLGAEYALPAYDKLRFGFLFTSRMAGQFAWHQGMLSVNVRPAKCFEVALTGAASSSGMSGGMVIDLHARRFNFFVGTDCFLSKMGKYGVPLNRANNSVSFGFGFPLSDV